MTNYDFNAIAIIAAKKNSNRFPGKNNYILKDKPMFFHSVEPFLESNKISKIYVATNSNQTKDYLKNHKKIEIIWRNKNAIHDEEPLISVLKSTYMQLNFSAKFICTIMANCPGHSYQTIEKGLHLIEKHNLNEIRSFNSEGEESGLIILRENIVLNAPSISSHIGMVTSEVNEIHYPEDLSNLNFV